MIKKQLDGYLVILLLISAVFFVANLFLVGQGLGVQNSPDENANLFFSQTLERFGNLKVFQADNQAAAGLISPRSIRAVGDFLVPASFLGLPLIYGSLAKITTLDLLPFFTPLIAFLASLFFYLLIKNLLNREIAFWSSVWLQLLPAWWYNANRVYLPNILFVSLVIIFAYFFWKSLVSKKILLAGISGVILGLGLMVRTSELVWLIPAICGVLIIQRSKWSWKQLLAGFVGWAIAFWPVFYFNLQNYGSYLSFGYNLALPSQGNLTKTLSTLGSILLPFGFHPRRVLLNVIDYLWLLSPLWSAVLLLGGIVALLYSWKNLTKVWHFWTLGLILAGYILVFYGSWNFNDNPDNLSKTIGGSFLRYWLPILVLAIPVSLWSLQKFLVKELYFNLATALVTMLLVIESLFLVVWGKDEGLAYIQNNLLFYQNFKNKVLLATPDNSIIIAGRFDKVLFPERQVIWTVPQEHWPRIVSLAKKRPVYELKYNLLASDVEYLNQSFYQPRGLTLTTEQLILGGWSLLKLKPANE